MATNGSSRGTVPTATHTPGGHVGLVPPNLHGGGQLGRCAAAPCPSGMPVPSTLQCEAGYSRWGKGGPQLLATAALPMVLGASGSCIHGRKSGWKLEHGSGNPG